MAENEEAVNEKTSEIGQDEEYSKEYSKENEDSLVKKLIERLKAEQETDSEDFNFQNEAEAISPSTPNPATDVHVDEPKISENAKRLAERRQRAQEERAPEERSLEGHTLEDRTSEEPIAQGNASGKRRRIISRKAKLTLLAGIVLFSIGFGIATYLMHLPNPERDVPRNVIQAIFSTKYMEAAELWGPLLSEETKRRSMNKLNTRIRPYMTKECYKKLDAMGLIGSVHRLAYESECNMVFSSFEEVSIDEIHVKTKLISSTSRQQNETNPSKTKAYRVTIHQDDVINKTPKERFAFVVIVTTTYVEKELIIEDISFEDESKLPVKTRTSR